MVKIKWVEYHGSEWMWSVECGWVTMYVVKLPDGTRMARMFHDGGRR